MKKAIRHWLLLLIYRWLARRQGMIFTRYDGEETRVDCCACFKCRNYFWAQNTTVEPPKLCPFCGNKFTKTVDLTGDEMKEIQVF